MKRAVVVMMLLTAGCASHAKPQIAPDPSPAQWNLPDSAADDDLFCAPTFKDDGPYGFQVCRSVGELRQFLRSKKT
jgi:hypothetical protein